MWISVGEKYFHLLFILIERMISMSEIYSKLMKHLEKSTALETALVLFQWDSETLAPEKSMELTAKSIGILSSEYYNSLINEDVKSLLDKLSEEDEQKQLDFNQKAIVKKLRKTFEEMEHIPPEEYQAYQELIAKAPGIWSKAKQENHYSSFAPYLEEIMNYNKKFAGYRVKEGQELYDVLLNDYEEGFNTKELDVFFDKVKSAIVPLLKEVVKKNDMIKKEYNYESFEIDKQKEFCNFISQYVGFDLSRGVIAESAHPFTTKLHNQDVRITNHFLEHNLESAIFSIIHETGHALYEMNVDSAITLSPVGTGASMGMHESQSRFFENIIGRSKSFWIPVFSKLQETFPEQLKDVSLDSFIKGINKSVPNLIRTEADELTYSLHIIIRYEIEKMIFAGEASIHHLPAIWNQKYKEYLGVEPPSDSNGILQDIHWSCGNIGYFPSYAIGSAIAAQIYYHMEAIMPFHSYLEEGNLAPISEYLKEHIHKYGASKNTNELLMGMMKEPLNPDYYVRYLTEKYTKLYEL